MLLAEPEAAAANSVPGIEWALLGKNVTLGIPRCAGLRCHLSLEVQV